MKTLLLIGGTGFFGKSFLDAYKRGLLSRWAISNIIVMSRNADKLIKEAPELLDSSIKLLSADICTINSLPNADYVIHAAASTDANSYINRPDIEKRNIQAATYNYCRLAKSAHAKNKILYVSSGAVYGAQPSNLEFLSEDYVLNDLEGLSDGKRNYAFAKRDAEQAIQALGGGNIKIAIARCFAFVGPWLPREQHFAIGNFIEDGFLGRPINVKANSTVYRSYMHADDLVYWLMTICDSANPRCPIYNVGSDEALTIRQLANLIALRFGVEVSKAELIEGRVDRYIPSILKAKIELGLSLTIDLSCALDKTIENIRSKGVNA
jgi:nucleoside-diphosphate-sugar epimerase